MSYKINIVKITNRCVVCGSLNLSALIHTIFSQFKLTLLNHQKSLELNFIILVLFSCDLLISSLFLVDSTSDLLSYYFVTILHFGSLFKSQQFYLTLGKAMHNEWKFKYNFQFWSGVKT